MKRTRRTLTTLSLTALGSATLAAAAPAPQGTGQSSALKTVRSIFQRLDRNGDDAVSAVEARTARVSASLFEQHDVDGSKGLDTEEFTVLYRALLTKADRQVPKEIQTEVARIQARRRAREEEAKRKEAEAEGQGAAPAEKEAGDPAEPAPGADPAPKGGAGPQGTPKPAQPAPATPKPARPAPVSTPGSTPGSTPAQPAGNGQAPAGTGQAPAGTGQPSPGPGARPIQPGSRPTVGPRPQGGKTGSGGPTAGGDGLTPEQRRIRAAREKWMLQWREAQLKKDGKAADSFGAQLPADLRADLLARVEAAWTGSLREWIAANPDRDITNLDPQTRMALAKLADQARETARNEWAAEKRAALVERARRAKQVAQDGGGDDGAGKGERQADDAPAKKGTAGPAPVVKPSPKPGAAPVSKPGAAPVSKPGARPVSKPGAKPAPRPQAGKGGADPLPAPKPKRAKRKVRPVSTPAKQGADDGARKGGAPNGGSPNGGSPKDGARKGAVKKGAV